MRSPLALALVVAALVFLLLAPRAAQPQHMHHGKQADANWYDAYCCSNQDCHAVPADEVEALPGGEYRWNGYTFKSDAIKPSKDSRFHACIWNGQARCLYVVQSY